MPAKQQNGSSDAAKAKKKKMSKMNWKSKDSTPVKSTSEESQIKESPSEERALKESVSQEPIRKDAVYKEPASTESDGTIRQKTSRPRHLLADTPVKVLQARHHVIFDEEVPSYLMCNFDGAALVPFIAPNSSEKRNSAIFSGIWDALSSIFCFTSSGYMPDDDYIIYTGSVDNSDEDDPSPKAPRKKKSLKKKSKSFIAETLNVFDWTAAVTPPKAVPKNPLVFSKEGDYANDKALLGLDLFEESQRIMKIFTGVTRVKGVTFNWTLRAAKNDVNIHTCDIPCSPWQAVKSDCVIKQNKHTILKLLTDDSRSHEYDESMEGYVVRIFPSVALASSHHLSLFTHLFLIIKHNPLSIWASWAKMCVCGDTSTGRCGPRHPETSSCAPRGENWRTAAS